MTRDERLKAALRDNLRRRKAQARERAGTGPQAPEPAAEAGAGTGAPAGPEEGAGPTDAAMHPGHSDGVPG